MRAWSCRCVRQQKAGTQPGSNFSNPRAARRNLKSDPASALRCPAAQQRQTANPTGGMPPEPGLWPAGRQGGTAGVRALQPRSQAGSRPTHEPRSRVHHSTIA